MTWQGPQPLIAVDRKCSLLRGSKLDDDRFAGTHILLHRQASSRILDNEVVRGEGRYAGQGQLDRLSCFYDQMARLIRVAIEGDAGTLDAIDRNGHHERRTRRCGFSSQGDSSKYEREPKTPRHIAWPHPRISLDEKLLTGIVRTGQMSFCSSRTCDVLTLPAGELL